MFSRLATFITELLGHPLYVFGSVVTVLVWLAAGPAFGWSDTWQLVINTLTTILTWIMVGFVQYSQNRDTKALHAKLDEILRAIPEADNAVRGIEKRP